MLVDSLRLGDEGCLTLVSEPFWLDVKRLTENSQDGMVRVQRAVDRRRQEHLGVELFERLLDDALACAWFTDEDAQASLLAMDPQGRQDLFLHRQECHVFGVEGVLIQTEIGTDHRLVPFAGRSLATKSTGRASPILSALK